MKPQTRLVTMLLQIKTRRHNKNAVGERERARERESERERERKKKKRERERERDVNKQPSDAPFYLLVLKVLQKKKK